MKEGETLTVVVSLGKAVNMPDIIGWKRAEVRQWCSKNGIPLDDTEEDYATSTGLCIKQSIPAGTLVKEGDYLTVIISKGNPKIPDFTGQSFDELREWVNQANIESANLTLNNPTYDYHDTYEPGKIISHTSSVAVGGAVNAVVSKGRNILLTGTEWDNLNTGTYTEAQVRQLCEDNKLTYDVTYVAVEGKDNGKVISVERSDGLQLKSNTYCPQSTIINIVVVDNPADPE